MNVLHVVPSFYPAFVYGGPITSVYGLCRSLARSGCNVRVLTTDANGLDRVLDVEKGRAVEINERLSVRYSRRRFRHAVSPELIRLLPWHVRWADIVHLTAVYSFPTFPTLMACKFSRKPVVWSPRGALQRWENSTRPTLKSVWEHMCRGMLPDRVVLHVTSEQEAAESQSRFPGLPAAVIPNGVEIPEAANHEDSERVLRLLFLGRIHQKKGIENLLMACDILSPTFGRNWSLTIAGCGDDSYMAHLRTRVSDMELSDQVSFAGEVLGEDKRKLFARSDIAIFPSYTENFGMVVAEALANAVPVITSKGTPWREVESKGCGLWLENDPRTLAKGIQDMSRRPLREMGQRGRNWMEKDFSWESVGTEMLTLYRKCIAS